jgi:Glucose / Sorbosone dehydrogenase
MHHRRPTLLALLLTVAALALPAGAHAAVSLHKVGDFNSPIFLAAAPGDASRLYVVERAGTVQVVRNGVKQATPFLSLGGVDTNGERGLLSIAFPPNFQTSHLFYAYFNNTAGDIEVDELRAIDGDHQDPAYRHTVIVIPHPGATNHNGGTAMFGRDGHLYLAPGDGGTGGANAHDMNVLLGKVLRIDPTPGGGYTIPAGNPFVGVAGRDEIWSYGLRNPFRFTIDPANGDLMIGDVGEGTTEEVDWAPAGQGGGRGADFGWNTCEGSFTTGSSTTPCTTGALPVIDQAADDGWHSIVAGYVVRDLSLPSLLGRFLYGDVSLGKIYSARLAQPMATDNQFLIDLPSVVAFALGGNGCTYAASLNGPVYRLVEGAGVCALPPAGAGTQDKTAPKVRTKTKRRQRVLHNGGVIGYARCPAEACRVSMSARVRIGKLSYPLHKVTKPATKNKRVKLRVKLTRRVKTNLKRARRHHKRAVVEVAYRARDGAGNRSKLGRARVLVTG